jgi:hypothetical protein
MKRRLALIYTLGLVCLIITAATLPNIISRSVGDPPSFQALQFPSDGAVLDAGQVLIAGNIFAPNGLSHRPLLTRRNLTLNSSDSVLLMTIPPENAFSINYVWPERILQAGDVILELSVTDDAGLTTTVSSHVTVTPDPRIAGLDTQMHAAAEAKGAAEQDMFADMSQFLVGVPEFAFDAQVAGVWDFLASQTTAAGQRIDNPWQPSIQQANSSIAHINAPDPVAAAIKADLLQFTNLYYTHAEILDNNYLTWIPAPNKDLLILQQGINSFNSLSFTSVMNGMVADFALSKAGVSLFSLHIDKSKRPPLVTGTMRGVPLTPELRQHPIGAIRPLLEDVYLDKDFDLFQNTYTKGDR